MYILGISAYYHDSAAALVKDGIVIAAAQEERFSRQKHDFNFPRKSIAFCLKQAGIGISKVDYVSFYDKPFIKFNRLLESYLHYAPYGISSFVKAMPLWLKQKLWIPDLISKELGYSGKVLFTEHHEAHAASAFYPSPFNEAAILTIDGVGEWATSSYGMADDTGLKIIAEQHFPHSLGLLYSAFTYFTGFKVNSGEYKVMGLAPYGEPKYVKTIYDNLLDVKDDGSFRMNMDYFDYVAGLRMTNGKFNRLFDGPPRKPENPLTQREMDLARSVQEVTEDLVLKMAQHVKNETGAKHLCLAGGVALNCVANGKLLREKIFDDIWIQPAAGDAGGALGSALQVYHVHLQKPVQGNKKLIQNYSYLGPEYNNPGIQSFLDEHDYPYKLYDDELLFDCVSSFIDEGKIVGWFQGRMEFGPRALGNRSIIGDARSPEMQKKMNLKIKYRESFRPFAPSVLEEEAHKWFDLDRPSPYMLLVADVKKEKQKSISADQQKLFGIEKLNVVRSQIPAVTHVDYSARIQTVSKVSNPRYYNLIKRFFEKTGCPVIVNTSFNVRGEPIVESPEQAYTCFMRTEMDALVLGNFVLLKEDQPAFSEQNDWRKKHELD
ncbi:MAG: carbamoyltransferase [Calditrichaeota bacterium]|nr:carbamoyltransferase [Calditrichota bacterium]